MDKKQVRNKFRTDVFKRDNYTCKIAGCGAKDDLDAHHITDRNDMPNGGYVLSNGITLCRHKHHIMAEKFHMTDGKEWEEGFHPDDLYNLIGSSYDQAVRDSVKSGNK